MTFCADIDACLRGHALPRRSFPKPRAACPTALKAPQPGIAWREMAAPETLSPRFPGRGRRHASGTPFNSRCRHCAPRSTGAGRLMQPSLGHVLVAERIARLAALGWHLDPSFGNYVQQRFPPDMPIGRIVGQDFQALAEGYGAELADAGGAEHLGGERAMPAVQRAEPEPRRDRQQCTLDGGDSGARLRLQAPSRIRGRASPRARRRS